MKKGIFLLLAGLLVLSGCGTTQTSGNKSSSNSSSSSPVSSSVTSSTSTSSPSSSSSSKSQKDNNAVLTKPGQSANIDAGKLTLLKIKNVNKSFNKNGLVIFAHAAKVFQLTNFSSAFKNAMESDGHTLGKAFYYLQFSYDVKNPFDQDITWNGFTTAVTDNGEQIDIVQNDIIGGSNPKDSKIISNAIEKQNLFGIPVSKDIKSIRLIPNQASDSSGADFRPEVGIKEIKINF